MVRWTAVLVVLAGCGAPARSLWDATAADEPEGDTGADVPMEDAPPAPCALPRRVCYGACTDTRTDTRNCGNCGTACGIDEPCVAGRCAAPCRGEYALCGLACVRVTHDPANCGECGNRCPAGQTCDYGECTAPQPALTDCGGTPVNLQTNEAHCGACGRACRPAEQCVGGVCRP